MTATLPQSSIDTTPSINTDALITVTPSMDLQAALNAAKPGQTIVLPAGSLRNAPPGGYILPAKVNPTGQVINIISDRALQFIPVGKRVGPDYLQLVGYNSAVVKSDLACIQSPDSGPVFSTASGASSFYRLTGLEVTTSPTAMKDAKLEADSNSGLIRLGDPAETALGNVPHHLTLDRCYVHGRPNQNTLRGVALNSAMTAIVNCYLSDFHAIGSDSQAIHGANGPGPFLIENNYIEGAAENLMFGGADPKIAFLIPSDITIRRNTFSKPLSWKHNDPSFGGYSWSVKNLLELKNAQRVLIEGNEFSNSWAMGQAGWIFSLKSVNQDGTAPWSVCQDVTIRHNVGHGAGGVFNLQGSDPDNKSGQTARIDVVNNLFYDIASTWNDGITGAAPGCFIQEYEITDLSFDHNTALCDGNIIIAYGDKKTAPFSFTNNIVNQNAYGVKGDGQATGAATLAAYFDRVRFSLNVIIGGMPVEYSTTFNDFPATLADVGFADIASSNYALSPTSKYLSRGVDMAALTTAISGAAAPVVAPVTQAELLAEWQRLGDMLRAYFGK